MYSIFYFYYTFKLLKNFLYLGFLISRRRATAPRILHYTLYFQAEIRFLHKYGFNHAPVYRSIQFIHVHIVAFLEKQKQFPVYNVFWNRLPEEGVCKLAFLFYPKQHIIPFLHEIRKIYGLL